MMQFIFLKVRIYFNMNQFYLFTVFISLRIKIKIKFIFRRITQGVIAQFSRAGGS